MDTGIIFELVGTFVYVVLAMIATWGAYCVIMAWRRVSQTRFRSEERQANFLDELEDNLTNGGFDDAMEFCDGDQRAMPQLALYAMSNRDVDYNRLRSRVAERFQRDVLADLEHRLSWVGTVIKSAPMIGLLGTVMGMMGAFKNLASGDKVDTTQMASDISFALMTTACGLAIAIPLVLCIASINERMRKMQDLVGAGLMQFFETLKTAIDREKK